MSKHEKWYWSDAEIQYLKDNYLTSSTTKMARVLNRPASAISMKMSRLDLVRPTKGKKGTFKANSASPEGSRIKINKKNTHTWLIKIGGNWKPYARYMWEQHNGTSVPTGHQVHFLDGNPDNFDAANLVALTPGDAMRLKHKRMREEKNKENVE
jgi:HNH endonuclease